MLVRVLGAVELVAADSSVVPLPGARQPALLAALAARADEVVSIDRLVDLLWDDDLPENPEPSLHSTVFKLRSRLRSVVDRPVLATRDRGYQLVLQPGDLDADVFSVLLLRSRDEPPEQAAETLREALALWRGAAYAGYADTEVARLAALALEEQRRSAVERLGAALLACGRAGEVVPLLEPFVAANPLREEPRLTLMSALHAAGRTAEALDQYHGYRRHLAEELGLEPSHAMKALQVELLQPPLSKMPEKTPARTRLPDGPMRRPMDDSSAEPAAGLPGLEVRYLRTRTGDVLAHGTTGSGPPLVVLLGWVSNLDVIASGRDPRSSLLERLSHHLSLTLFDRGGTGLSPGPVSDYSLERSVEELAEVVRNVGPPVSLLAMSAAGPIAVELAVRYPEWMSSLVFFGTFADGPATFADKRLRDMVVDLTRDHWGMGSKVLADLYRPGVSDDAAWHLAQVFRDSATPNVAAEYLSATYDYDVADLLPSVTAPGLVLHYRGDRLIGFRGAQDLAAGLPTADLLPLDGRVHLPDAKDLDRIERAVVDHVRRHS